MDVSIVIPVKNAGDTLDSVLEAIFSQKTEYSYEVICVDSGSKDQSLNIIRKYPCKLFEIPASEFGHGKTRNYGASKGTGEFIVFITQDAKPASETWLQSFIDAMKMDPEIVGGFGIHYPYENCNLLDKRDLKFHFAQFGNENTIYQLTEETRAAYDASLAMRQKMMFFSDNNACVRRSVFEEYPYDDVNFSEDQIWAKKMIEMGCKKVYCPAAPVYHSHNYPVSTYFKRYYDEFKGLYSFQELIMVPHWYQIPVFYIKSLLRDSWFVVRQPISLGEKFYWLWYALRRDFCRSLGAYLGGNYHRFTEEKKQKLDHTISQQYEQRNS